MKKNAFLVVMTWLFALNLIAVPVDVVTARREATSFVASKLPGRFSSPSTVALTLAYTQPSAVDADVADYYVFNASDGSAFVIVSGDDRAESILAYGNGTIDMNRLPCNVRCWLDLYKEQLDSLHARPLQQAAQESSVYPVVSPLLTCRWNQSAPYNRMCPEVNGSHCVTGCVATAMAQIMYYWQYPDTAPSLPAYTTSTRNIFMAALPEAPFLWKDMLDSYKGIDYSDGQAEAVAMLMRYCGQSVKMDYGPGSSAALIGHVAPALAGFGYNSAITLLTRYNYADSLWVEMINEDLTAGRPVLYTADNASYSFSHALVIDGCDGSRFHINWGWGGTADGYYALDAFAMGMNHRHGMLFQTFPEGRDGVQPAYDFEIDGIYYKKTGETVRVTFGSRKYNGEVVIPEIVSFNGHVFPVTSIGPGAFAHCQALTSVVIGGKVSSVGENAFDGCASLERITLPAIPVTFHHQAFAGCSALDTVDLVDLNAWLTACFMDDEACPMYYARHLLVSGEEITHVDVPEGVTMLQDCLFRNCQSLVSVNIPNTVTSIGSYTFYHCTSLTRVALGDAVTSIGYCAFAGCKQLRTIDLPASLHEISRYAFKDCEHLESIEIPDAVSAIGGYTFNRCSRLRTVVLGSSVDTIGFYAFAGCPKIDTLVCKAVMPPRMSSKSCFHSQAYAGAVVLVPRVSHQAYLDDDLWRLFSNLRFVETGAGWLDMNGDGEVNIADVNLLIDLIINGTREPACDANGDGELGVGDVNFMIDSILLTK